jgi:hypothetical protein
MAWLETLSANTTIALLTGRAGAAVATAGLELAAALLEDVFEVAALEVLGVGKDELETVTVFSEFPFATEVFLSLLSALFESEDFGLLERTDTDFADEPVPSEVLAADPVEVFVLGLVDEYTAFGAASGCFEFNAVAEDGTAFDSIGAGIVVVL